MPIKRYRQIDIRIYAAIISILLCLIAYSKSGPINYDGILYLTAATAYLKSGLAAAMQLYPWPFYSILIAWLSKLTTLTPLHAAYVLNNVLLIITVTTFITLLKELGAAKRLQIVGAVVILIYPQLNDYRDFVVRDFGYWAFFLVAFWQLLCFSKTRRWLNALAWGAAILIATLFRIEGLIIFLFAPLILLFLQNHTLLSRLKLFLLGYSVLILGVIIVALYSISHPAVIDHLGRIPEALHQIKNGWQLIKMNFHSKMITAGDTVLAPYSTGDAPLFMVWGLAGLFIGTFISTLSSLYTLLVGYGIYTDSLKIYKNDKLILYYFIALNLIITGVFFVQQFFLSGRYLLALCLLLLLWAPSALEQLYINWKYKSSSLLGQPWFFPLIILSMVLMASSAFIQYGYSKAYITQAGRWLDKNTPADIKLYSNNKQILFYANRTPIDLTVNWLEKYDDSKPLQTVQSKAWQGYDYMALRVTHQSLQDEKAILQAMGQQPVQVFKNKRGDEVLIFKLKPGG